MTTIHTRQLQQYTRQTNNNYTQDNLKLATIHCICRTKVEQRRKSSVLLRGSWQILRSVTLRHFISTFTDINVNFIVCYPVLLRHSCIRTRMLYWRQFISLVIEIFTVKKREDVTIKERAFIAAFFISGLKEFSSYLIMAVKKIHSQRHKTELPAYTNKKKKENQFL